MESIMIKGVQLVAALALLVVIHEFGHYIMARIFGIKVEKFYLFFNPWFSLAKWKPKKKAPKYDSNGNERATWRDTEYGIGWVPFGGYVKIAGMIDESMDTEQMAQPEKPWEFRAKPAYQRLLVMVGGVTFNFILAILIYSGIAWYWGEKYVPIETAYEGMDFGAPAIEAGFRNGDIPMFADNNPIDASQDDMLFRMVNAKTVTVLRDHKDTVNVAIPNDFMLRFGKDDMFMTYRQPVFVDNVQGGSPAADAGIITGDRIVAVDTVATPSYTELTAALERFAGKPTTVTVEREGHRIQLAATPDSNGKLGFRHKDITDVYPTVFIKYGFFESFPKGWEIGTGILGNYVSSLKHLFSTQGVKSIGGFGTIGSMFPDRWNWYSFWSMTAFLSVILAFMNIIPIPGLDGGHVMFLLWEVVTRRKPSDKVLIYAQYAGMLFIILLLVYANGADLFRAIM